MVCLARYGKGAGRQMQRIETVGEAFFSELGPARVSVPLMKMEMMSVKEWTGQIGIRDIISKVEEM